MFFTITNQIKPPRRARQDSSVLLHRKLLGSGHILGDLRVLFGSLLISFTAYLVAWSCNFLPASFNKHAVEYIFLNQTGSCF